MSGDFIKINLAAVTLLLGAGGAFAPASAEPVARETDAVASVIARKTGEEVRFIDVSNWRFVDLQQDLLTGDVLRTNATGQLAILFADRTQIRLGRNSSLRVRQMKPGSDAVLELEAGTIWARAERGGPGVEVVTPAATAAIRGTDWTMTVKGAETSLTVLEGLVELSNPQGSVQVAQGEAAAATIGQAPRKVVIVDSDDREQMLFYLAPRNAFNFMPASTLPVADMRREADRIAAIPADQRSTADLLVLAEVQLSLESREDAKKTLAMLRARTLSPTERARADLVEAIIAAAELRYEEADRLFGSAGAHLDQRRRDIADYGRYYARSLANPNRLEPQPRRMSSPYGALMQAYAAGFLKDIRAAIDVIKEAERRFPKDPALPAYRAQLALLLNDREQVREAIDKSLALDPSEPTALEARANYRAGVESDLDGALADLEAALKVAPGSTSIWNAIGDLHSARGDMRAAEAALKKAIALDPMDPVSYANLALLYLDQSRVEEAKHEIDLALAADPTFDVALVARGRYHMQTGELDKAVDDLLAGTVSNPSYAQGQGLLAAAHFEKGDRVPAEQALDNADRLDDNDPVISSFRAAVAIDDYDSEGAIRNAQEFLRRAKARGGHFGSLSANQDAGSTLNNAFRLQGLNAWGEYYGDAVFDPFAGSAYIDQTVRGSANPFANSYVHGGNVVTNGQNSLSYSSFIQGLLLDPHMLSGRSRSANLIRRPFFEGALGGGFTQANGDTGYLAEGEAQGFSNLPFPISFYGNVEWETDFDQRTGAGGTLDLDTEERLLRGNGYVAASPSPYDRFVAYANHSGSDSDLFASALGGGGTATLKNEADQTNIGVGLSHTIGFENVVNAALFYSDLSADSFDTLTLSPLPLTSESSQKAYVAAISHSVGMDDLTWRYGVEGGRIETYSQSWLLGVPTTADPDENATYGRVYVDLLHEITPDLKAEYALFGTFLDGDDDDVARLEPRVGIAWAPSDQHWLRAAYSRQSLSVNTPTLSPVGVLGLQPNEISTGLDGYVDTVALRWDAEWTQDFFTSAEFQHQDIEEPLIAIPFSAAPFSASEGRIDRGSVTANLLIGHGFGLSSTIAYAISENEDPTSPTYGGPLPFVPDWAGQVALTWVNEANVSATLAANYVGERDTETGDALDDYWTLDANLTWEPFDKRFALELAGYNLLDQDFEVNTNTPGWGPTFTGSVKVRF
ncbi:tetratricopeptide repeat protein [Rhizobium sp. KAs_5_22]|uniref:FecR domain-containing protein n=1 Tax=Ciceribacter selenitireducens TaxID=448181 RepID=UPI0004918F46|nr:FecR domain-containing protein [Ciceribacter selenitireducens]PPJ47710.1 tetratricopeptide repeat protein [Rhizobium sp. KAs_5_22]